MPTGAESDDVFDLRRPDKTLYGLPLIMNGANQPGSATQIPAFTLEILTEKSFPAHHPLLLPERFETVSEVHKILGNLGQPYPTNYAILQIVPSSNSPLPQIFAVLNAKDDSTTVDFANLYRDDTDSASPISLIPLAICNYSEML